MTKQTAKFSSIARIKEVAAKKTKKEDTSPYIYQDKKSGLSFQLNCKVPFTDKQKEFLELINSPECKLLIVKGPAGVGKSLLAIYAGLMAIQEKRVSSLVYVRSLVESSSKSMGYIKGSIAEKSLPFMEAGLEKLEELCGVENAKNLIEKGTFEMKPLNFLRGTQFTGKFICADEFQCADISETLTLLSRIGERSKVVLMGDPMQSDIGNKTALSKVYDLFDCEESRGNGVFVFEFTEDDIMRSKLLRFIVKKFKEI